MSPWPRRARPRPHAVPNPRPESAAPTSPAAADSERLLRRLEWTVLKRLDGLLQGDYRTLIRGTGLDLADLREYQFGDDVRHIDWNVTARLQTPYVRIFTADREMAAWFLLDLSPSVDFGSGARSKRELATELVALLARILTRHGNRVGAVLYGRGVDQVLPARPGRTHVLQLMHAIGRQPPAGDAAPAITHLADLLQAGLHIARRRATVFVISDFISSAGWERPLAQLALRHDVVAVRLADPLERELPDLGLITLRDSETGESLLVDTHDRAFRERFAQQAAARETALQTALANAGVDTLELATDDDLMGALLRFVDLRRRRVGIAAGRTLPGHLRAHA